MQWRSTSTQRTYRAVRLSLVAVVVLLAAAVTAEIVASGPLGSVSAAYYTPARNVFVGGLSAAALALLALSGRSVEQVLLDLAAVLAAVVAFVPVPITADDLRGEDPGCPTPAPCVPAWALPDVANAVFALAVVGVVMLGVAAVIGATQRTITRGAAAGWGAVAALVVAVVLWAALAPASFLASAHLAAAAGLFGLIGAVAVLAGLRPAVAGQRRRRLRTAYLVVAVAMAASLLFLVAVAVIPSPPVLFFAGEAAALGVFAVFWVVQTIEWWNDPDPALRNRE